MIASLNFAQREALFPKGRCLYFERIGHNHNFVSVQRPRGSCFFHNVSSASLSRVERLANSRIAIRATR